MFTTNFVDSNETLGGELAVGAAAAAGVDEPWSRSAESWI